MKTNWKKVALYILRLIELIITGAAGGTIAQMWFCCIRRDVARYV